jgi:hypothetical protein
MLRRLGLGLGLGLAGCGGSSEVDWSRHDASRECAPAIDGWHAGGPTPPCSALHMCANEARLSGDETKQLDAMIAAGKCAPL